MLVQDQIVAKLVEALKPDHLSVENESYKHSVPPDSETHFKVVVSSDQFAGKRSVQRHQLVYALLQDEMAQGVHALALHTYTPQEWITTAKPPASPNCMSSGKVSN